MSFVNQFQFNLMLHYNTLYMYIFQPFLLMKFFAAVEDVKDSITGIEKYQQGGDLNECSSFYKNLEILLEGACTEQPLVDVEPGFKDNLLYIYTSGTTGLPKAVLIPHSR